MNTTLETLATDSAVAVWATALGTAGVFVLLTVLVWQTGRVWRDRAVLAREEQYRRLAEKYAQLLEQTTESQQRMAADLAEARTSVASMERMMREVE